MGKFIGTPATGENPKFPIFPEIKMIWKMDYYSNGSLLANIINVGKTITIINHPFANGLYHLFMVISGMAYYCFAHTNVPNENPSTQSPNVFLARTAQDIVHITVPLCRLELWLTHPNSVSRTTWACPKFCHLANLQVLRKSNQSNPQAQGDLCSHHWALKMCKRNDPNKKGI